MHRSAVPSISAAAVLAFTGSSLPYHKQIDDVPYQAHVTAESTIEHPIDLAAESLPARDLPLVQPHDPTASNPSGRLAGLLIWSKLRLVTSIPRSAYAMMLPESENGQGSVKDLEPSPGLALLLWGRLKLVTGVPRTAYALLAPKSDNSII